METISTTLHAEALKRDLERYRDTVGYVDRERIGQRMVDTVNHVMGDKVDCVGIVETIMLLPEGHQVNLVEEIFKIISPVIKEDAS